MYYGLGRHLNDMLAWHPEMKNDITLLIDSDNQKWGGVERGLIIEPPYILKFMPARSEVVIAAIAHYSEIEKQIHHLNPSLHCISIDDRWQELKMRNVQEKLASAVFSAYPDTREKFVHVHSQDEYARYLETHHGNWEYANAMQDIYMDQRGKKCYVGHCSYCDAERAFIVGDGTPSFREGLICPVCGLNSRQRAMFGYLKNLSQNALVYCYEAITPFFQKVKSYFPQVKGSEYLGPEYKSGEVVNGVMHQDALNLSYANESFDCMVSCDVFEHVSDYRKALQEAFRCLKKGGELVFTIPFYNSRYASVTRAVIENGEIKNILPPEYHGNPLGGGSLVFTEIGWQIIDDLLECGFSDAYALYHPSVSKGYIDFPSCIFVGKK